MSNKNGPSITRTNLIGRTIFVTSEKHCPTNHRPQTKFFTSEKIVSVFPPFRRASQANDEWTKHEVSLFPLSRGFLIRLFMRCRYFFMGGIRRRPRKRKHTLQNKALQNVALLNGRPQFRSPCLFAYLSSLRIAICGRCYSWWSIQHFYQQPFFNRQPWQFQKLRRAFSKEVNWLKALERPLWAIV